MAKNKDSRGTDAIGSGRPIPPDGVIEDIPSIDAQDQTEVTPPLPAVSPDTVSTDDDAYSILAQKRAEQKSKRLHKRIAIICIVAAALVALFVIPSLFSKPAATPVNTTTVTKQDYTDTVSTSGTLEPVNSVVVAPAVDGTIDAVNVSLGSTVSQGDVLFTIKNSKLDDAVTEADLKVKSAKQAYQQACDQSDQDYQTYLDARNQAQAAGTSDATATYDTAAHQGAIDSAQIALQEAQQAYDEAVAEADKRTVTAPMSGSVITMNAVSGTAVSSGVSASSATATSSTPLVEIGDLSQMKIKVEVNEVDVAKMAVDQTASVTFPAVSGLTLDAHVTNIATTATTSSSSSATSGSGVVTYTVELIIDSPDASLKPGMTANAAICTKSLPSSLTVPLNALQTDDTGATFVEVQKDDGNGSTTTEHRAVTVTAKNSTTAVIEGNVAEGDTIVIPDQATTSSATTASATTGA